MKWSEGGKEDFCDRVDITMSHDELVATLGPAYAQIEAAGFVLVPKRWREDVFKMLDDRLWLKKKMT